MAKLNNVKEKPNTKTLRSHCSSKGLGSVCTIAATKGNLISYVVVGGPGRDCSGKPQSGSALLRATSILKADPGSKRMLPAH